MRVRMPTTMSARMRMMCGCFEITSWPVEVTVALANDVLVGWSVWISNSSAANIGSNETDMLDSCPAALFWPTKAMPTSTSCGTASQLRNASVAMIRVSGPRWLTIQLFCITCGVAGGLAVSRMNCKIVSSLTCSCKRMVISLPLQLTFVLRLMSPLQAKPLHWPFPPGASRVKPAGDSTEILSPCSRLPGNATSKRKSSTGSSPFVLLMSMHVHRLARS
mmetsp:Transcript_46810/g.130395  ORF Transcript_46810/g.130395 Transcript_46810/m.130395 type:complete len:220 (-) Transcript_46810:626-1285(-)